ncbi:MAG TPA: extracellular solute-binding protein [Candidatus Woesebacteria bacterium]|nr:extracellular solute-binding protein [Candidatus Woesebacteria bacterium]
MPSQNLPKPNVPGQTNDQGQANPSAKVTSVFPKTTPGISSRENPAGRPPAKPTLTPNQPLTQPGDLSQSQTISPIASATSRPTTPATKMAMPKDLNDKEQKIQMPQPFVPSEIQSTAKPVIAPAAKVLTTDAGVSTEDLELTQPTSAPQPNSANDQPTVDTKDLKNGKNVQPPKKKGKFPLPKPILILLLLLVVGLIGFVVFRTFFAGGAKPTPVPSGPNQEVGQPKEIINITYWGLWEDGEILNEVFKDFEAKEGIRVDYRKQSHRDYRERLEQALISGSGPDVFRYHITWVPMLSSQLAPMPNSVMTSAEYQQTFYPIAYESLQANGGIVGLPLMYDGLALFYNKEMLANANLPVPTTWSELRGVANQLTVPGNVSIRRDDNITQAGLAIGNASNVDHFSDILALLILQNGGDPTDPTSQNVVDALTFYTNFIRQDKVWSNNLPNSTMAFARGEVAMIFAPSWRALEIKQINPELDFAIAPVPQLSNEEKVTWASFWAEGVNKNSSQSEAAWKLLDYLSSPEVLKKFFNSASLVRTFGEIYPRTDMANELSEDELLGAYVADAPFAQSFPMTSFTHDNGLNDQLIQYYADAINAVLAGTQPDKALQEISSGISQVVQKYGLN